MNFLSEVLPGFRELRAPIIGGYLWLVAIVALLGGVPDPSSKTAIGDLITQAGPIALAAAASVIAYLIGSVADDIYEQVIGAPDDESITSAAIEWKRTADEFVRSDYEVLRAESPEVEISLPLNDFSADDFLAKLSNAEKEELEEIKAKSSRISSEAQMRLSVAVPVLVTSLVLGFKEDTLWFFGVGAFGILMTQYLLRKRKLRRLAVPVRDFRIAVAERIEAEALGAQSRRS